MSTLEQHVTYRNNSKAWMTSDIFMEFLNKLNKMKLQGRHIIMLLNNCLSHPAITLSNIKLVFYPKNCTSKLQAMDFGVIANLKAKYKQCTHNQARIMAKTVKDVREFVSKLTIFDAIIHCKNAWDAMSPETIVKCFKNSGVYDFNESPPCSSECGMNGNNNDEDTEFSQYFENLLGIPWFGLLNDG